MQRRLSALALGAALVVLSVPMSALAGQASPAVKTGSGVYVNYCGSCHGPNAKGDGPMAPALTKKPADLTQIAKRNGGKFPSDAIYRTIDGRNPVFGHGGQEMPVWGNVFLRADGGTTVQQVKARIDALVAYLESIQVK